MDKKWNPPRLSDACIKETLLLKRAALKQRAPEAVADFQAYKALYNASIQNLSRNLRQKHCGSEKVEQFPHRL